jgi:putative ABC transport system permease protein
MELVEGRNFSPNIPSDSLNGYILNEAAVKALGWTSAVGKKFGAGTVIGVVKDFHFQSFDFSIEPLFLKYRNATNLYGISNFMAKIDSENTEAALAHVENTLKTMVPDFPMEYHFLDDTYNQLYNTEKRFGKAFNLFTFIALFIAGIGLFGLVTFQVNRRTKEIGIRKVLGATTTGLVALLSKDFLKLVFVALVIASPLAYFFMEKWLQDFSYRIDISWWTFALAGFAAIIIAFVTVSFQSVKAALANPVETLRSE